MSTFHRSSLASASDAEEEELMREVCSSNGLMYSRLRQEGLSCLSLEMFFSGYPRMVGLQNFPNLQVLRIVGQAVKKIEGLRCLPKLKELWIIECNLKSMAGLDDAKQLRRLFLYSNSINKIEHLEHMTELQSLWLNNNKITVLEGLSNLKQLKELNLAENWIDTIGNALNNLQRLEILELSGNRMYSFKDITNLSRLGSLRSVGFKSPIYPPSGVSLLCNYAIHVVYHLGQLSELDSADVSSKAIKDTADAIVNKKKIFYGMQVKTLRRKFADIRNRLTAVKDHLMEPYADRIRTLCSTFKEIDKEVHSLMTDEEEAGCHGSGTESDQDAKLDAKWSENRAALNALRSKQKAIKERMKLVEKKISDLGAFHADAVERARQAVEGVVHQVVSELESGGNIRFEYGKPTDPWFIACQDLVLNRFCAKDFQEFHITGVQIQSITRVVNRRLRLRFEDAMQAYMEDDDSYLPSAKQNAYKKQLEYLFWIWDPELTRGQAEPARTVEEGFMSSGTYEQLGKDAAVPLTNSLHIADRCRIEYLIKQSKGKDKDAADPCPFRNGRLVIAKAFLGRSQQAERHTRSKSQSWTVDDARELRWCEVGINRKIEESHFAKADSLFRYGKDCGDGHAGGDDGHEVEHCECAGRQCEWFIFNHETVVPEYVVDFEYISQVKPKSPFHSLVEAEIVSIDKEPKAMQWPEQDLHQNDDDVLRRSPDLKPHPRIVALSDELLLKITRARSLNAISVLNLHGNGLIRLKHLQALTLLRRLTISFNDLTKLDDLAGLNIEYLDASFNKITTVEGLKSMSKLRVLDLTWNRLQSTREEISWLHKHAPALTTLDVRHNPWQKPESMRLRVLGRLRTVTRFNGVQVTDDEVTAALRMAAGSRISQVTLLSHSRMDFAAPRTLCLSSVAQTLSQISRLKPDRVAGDQDVGWQSKITSLCLDGQHISKLSGLEQLVNLRWASFNDNYITKIEGLDGCSKLEELSLENNCIRRLEGASFWPLLRRLSLGHNFITTFEGSGLDRNGNRLQYLSVDSNNITSLSGLQKVSGLVELYLSNNLIDSVREVFSLKNLASLIILDLSGNPVSITVENYRLFIIYHLKSLKALDGTSVETSDSQLAKETLGGRMTQDFVAEKIGHSNFGQVTELDCPQCGIQSVDLGDGQLFQRLRSVNLEHNNLSSFSGLIHLQNLKVLCLNHNRVESVIPKPKPPVSRGRQLQVSGTNAATGMSSVGSEIGSPVLNKLEVLHLGYNGIKDMAALQLGRLPSLKALFLQGNEISKVEGLENLRDLLELVLDRNKIKSINDTSFASQRKLQELHIEENRLRSLANLHHLENLLRLYVAMNRIQDMPEIEKLEPLSKLTDISLVNNSVAKRLLHRPILVFRNPSLKIIDGITVTDEERTKAQLYFMDHQPQAQPPLLTTALDTTLPGISQYKMHLPVKVTNVQLLSPPQIWGAVGSSSAEDAALHDFIKGGAKKKSGGRSLDAAQSTLPHSGGGSGGSIGGGTMSYHHGPSNTSNGKTSLPPPPHYPMVSDYTSSNDRYSKGPKR